MMRTKDGLAAKRKVSTLPNFWISKDVTCRNIQMSSRSSRRNRNRKLLKKSRRKRFANQSNHRHFPDHLLTYRWPRLYQLWRQPSSNPSTLWLLHRWKVMRRKIQPYRLGLRANMVDARRPMSHRQVMTPNATIIRACRYSTRDLNIGHAAQNAPPILQRSWTRRAVRTANTNGFPMYACFITHFWFTIYCIERELILYDWFLAKRFHGHQMPLRLASNGHQRCDCHLRKTVPLREEHGKIESSPVGRTIGVSATRQCPIQFRCGTSWRTYFNLSGIGWLENGWTSEFWLFRFINFRLSMCRTRRHTCTEQKSKLFCPKQNRAIGAI